MKNNNQFTNIMLENRIKEIVEERGITLKWLANKIDISYSGMISLANRKKLNTSELLTIYKISVVLQCNIYDLFNVNRF